MSIVLHALRCKNPRAPVHGTAFPEPSIFIDTENIFLEDILALCIQTWLTFHQTLNLLERSERIDEMEQRVREQRTK